jgi:hypothetical protein
MRTDQGNRLRRAWSRGLVALGAGLATLAAHGDGPPRPPPPRVLIPFDFASAFDQGRYGAMIGDQVWAKVRRRGGFVLPESPQDVRDWCERNRVHPNPDTPLAEVARAVREQAGDVAIWGRVERAPGEATDVYDLRIRVADFTADPPRILHDATARTKTVGEIPHVHLQAALDALYGKAPEAEVAKAAGPAGPSLVKGAFEVGRTGPIGWDPLPRSVSWVPASGPDAKARGKVIRFTLDEATAGSTGVLYYSEPFPVVEGATYRFSCRWRSTGSAAKVFVKCYDEFASRYRDPAGKALASQRREVYRSQQNLAGEPNTWNAHAEDFTPRHAQFTPKWGRVMLYAYWPAGVVEWDDVAVQVVAPGRR